MPTKQIKKVKKKSTEAPLTPKQKCFVKVLSSKKLSDKNPKIRAKAVSKALLDAYRICNKQKIKRKKTSKESTKKKPAQSKTRKPKAKAAKNIAAKGRGNKK